MTRRSNDASPKAIYRATLAATFALTLLGLAVSYIVLGAVCGESFGATGTPRHDYCDSQLYFLALGLPGLAAYLGGRRARRAGRWSVLMAGCAVGFVLAVHPLVLTSLLRG